MFNESGLYFFKFSLNWVSFGYENVSLYTLFIIMLVLIVIFDHFNLILKFDFLLVFNTAAQYKVWNLALSIVYLCFSVMIELVTVKRINIFLFMVCILIQ